MAIPLKEPTHHFTYKDYKHWPAEKRWELIAGEPFDMSPAPTSLHQRISREIGFQIYNNLKAKKCELFTAPFDVFLPEGEVAEDEIDTIVQPDLMVICDPRKITPKGCMGAPDIIIEILSPSTGAKDKKLKLALYEKHGVKAYWIVDPNDKTIMAFTAGAGGEYGKPQVFTATDTLTTPVLEKFKIKLAEIFQDW